MPSDTKIILEANQAFYRAFERKDLAAMGAVWSKGVGSLCIHPGRDVIVGWEDINRSWEQIFKNTEYFEIELEIRSTDISGDLAYVVLVEKLFQVVRGQRVQAKSMATNIFERMGPMWYLVHHHGSPVMR